VVEELVEEEIMITKRQWDNLNRKLNDIQDSITKLEQRFVDKRKKWLKFDECVPPIGVCKEIYSMLTGLNTFTGFLGKLSEYYGCESLEAQVDESINKKYKAVYNPQLKIIYSRTKTVSIHTILHEWFHHMVNLNIVVIHKMKEEKLADKYADIFLKRAEVNE